MASKLDSKLARSATLRQLQVFSTIARLNSFSKAAEELHLTQPTVSMQVKKLSESLDSPLFETIGRKTYLTEAGEVLYQSSQIILEQLSIAEQNINHLKGFSGGQVQLSIISTAQYFVPKVIYEFNKLYPDVNVSLRIGNKESLSKRIADNKDDFYILGQPTDDMNVESTQLAVNPLAFVANSQHKLVGQKLSIEDLADEPFIMREPGSGIRAQVKKVFDGLGFSPNVKMVLGGNEATRLGLLQGLGITIASIPTLLEEINHQKIAVLNVKGFPINRHWYLAYPKGKQLSLASKALYNMLLEEGKKISYKDFSAN